MDKYAKEVVALRAKAQATPVEHRLYFADYRDVEGLKLPFRLRRAIGTETTEETTFDRFRINTKIDPQEIRSAQVEPRRLEGQSDGRDMMRAVVMLCIACLAAAEASRARPTGAPRCCDGAGRDPRRAPEREGHGRRHRAGEQGGHHRAGADRRAGAGEVRQGVARPLLGHRRVLRISDPRLPEVRIRRGENRQVVMLPIDRLQSSVTVSRDRQQAAADRDVTFGTVLTREQIDALSDDPDELRRQLMDIAGPDAKILVDSFEGRDLPPKAMIKSIRITRDQFAPEVHYRRRVPHRDPDPAGHRSGARQHADGVLRQRDRRRESAGRPARTGAEPACTASG